MVRSQNILVQSESIPVRSENIPAHARSSMVRPEMKPSMHHLTTVFCGSPAALPSGYAHNKPFPVFLSGKTGNPQVK
ncbi:MAG: hypothetical protein LBT83_12325 [Tannerella sp.]|nr:hypothetical protein [Tannerella sp.]